MVFMAEIVPVFYGQHTNTNTIPPAKDFRGPSEGEHLFWDFASNPPPLLNDV